MTRPGLLFAALTLALIISGCKTNDLITENKNYSARLTGEQQVPAISTKAHGMLTLESRENGTQLFYSLEIGQIQDVTTAHIHIGKPGEIGPPIAMLYPGPIKKGEYNGNIAKGIITADSMVGPMEGKSVGDLIDQIRAGNTYANVHTLVHPDGEIRGQILQ